MMTVAIIGCLLGSLVLEVGILYCMLKQEFKNKMDEKNDYSRGGRII